MESQGRKNLMPTKLLPSILRKKFLPVKFPNSSKIKKLPCRQQNHNRWATWTMAFRKSKCKPKWKLSTTPSPSANSAKVFLKKLFRSSQFVRRTKLKSSAQTTELYKSRPWLARCPHKKHSSDKNRSARKLLRDEKNSSARNQN